MTATFWISLWVIARVLQAKTCTRRMHTTHAQDPCTIGMHTMAFVVCSSYKKTAGVVCACFGLEHPTNHWINEDLKRTQLISICSTARNFEITPALILKKHNFISPTFDNQIATLILDILLIRVPEGITYAYFSIILSYQLKVYISKSRF